MKGILDMLKSKKLYISIFTIFIIITIFKNTFRCEDRRMASTACAFGVLIEIFESQEKYKIFNNHQGYAGSFRDLENLLDSRLLPLITKNSYCGYNFKILHGKKNGIYYQTWGVSCWPKEFETSGMISLYIDQTGIIRQGEINGKPGNKFLKKCFDIATKSFI
jgi:hypothetical protein